MKEPLGVRPSRPLRPWGMKRVSLDKTDDLDSFNHYANLGEQSLEKQTPTATG